ncbi:MAG: TonB-dependent receptor, partial [Flavobacteriaceae bacterium]|nr:TonB-dependent receptor [Flavobacteriaceae bacterium]
MKKYIIILSFLLFAFTVFSQETGSLKGTVTDKETGKAITNAEVLVVETSQGTVASENGTFEIKNIKPGIYTIQFHALGYTAETFPNIEVESGKSTPIKISMKTGNIKLNEITISASKIEKTIDKIGSPVYVMGIKELERTEGRNIEEALIRVPGVFTEDRYHNETNIVSFRGVG